MFRTFPGNPVGNWPYKVLFASGDWTCSIARFTGTIDRVQADPGGKDIPLTGRCTALPSCLADICAPNGHPG
ncbi:MAG: hypothetical protein ACRDOD_13350 [Streptosporangiaceae bacterium]